MYLFIFIFSVLFLGFVFNRVIKKPSIKQKKTWEELLEIEKYNIESPKKEFKKIEYLQVSAENLPFIHMSNSLSIEERSLIYFQNQFLQLIQLPLISLGDLSNKEIKETYGRTDFNDILTYEDNYRRLLQLIVKWGEALLKLNRTENAQAILEKGITMGSDLPLNYTLLYELYKKQNNEAKCKELLSILQIKSNNCPSFKKKYEEILKGLK